VTVERTKHTFRRRLVVALAAVATAGAGSALTLRPEPVAIATVAVERAVVTDEVSSASAGEVEAAQAATLRAELSATVTRVPHRRGDRLRAGDVVVVLDASDLDAKLLQAQAAVGARRAQVAQAVARATATQVTATRQRALAERGAETAQRADDAEAEAVEAAAAARSAEAQLREAEAAVSVARAARAKAELVAPFAGVLAELRVDRGDHVQPGTVIAEVVDDTSLRVEATLDEADIGRVRIGQPASLRLDALPGRPLAGHVSRLDPTVLKDEKGARTLRFEIEVDDPGAARGGGLRPGMSANVDIRVAERAGVLSVPTSVVVGRGARRAVYRIEGGVARERLVEVGVSGWDRSEVLAGLADGDVVVADLNAKGLANGMRVKPAARGAR
jgi:HlyD family secretion protein